MKYKNIKLNKGAVLRYVKNNISQTTAVEICFDCGARCDTVPGLAHFTEHMFFTGTKDLNKEQVTKRYYDFINVNAFTSTKDIYFAGNIFSHKLKDYLLVVADMIKNSTFSKKAVENEIPVVQQEIVRGADKHNFFAFDTNKFNITNLPVYKDGILGSKESVASITSKDVKSFVKKYFVANNCSIYISSPYSAGKVKNIINKYFISALNENNLEKLPLYYDDVQNDRFLKIKNVDIKKNYLFLNFIYDKTVYDFEFNRYAMLFRDVLNDVSAGIMNPLRLEKGLVYSASAYTNRTDKASIMSINTECNTQNINKVLETVSEYFKNLYKKGITANQLKLAKQLYNYEIASKEPSVRGEMHRLYDYKYYGKIIKKNYLLKLTRNATVDQVNQVMRYILENSKISCSIYGNATKKDVLTQKEFFNLFDIAKQE